MSRGFGIMENYLLGVVGREPMTFEQILNIAFPEGTFDGDMARTLGASQVAGPRSMRRALFRLCDNGILQKLGIKTPHSYRLSPIYLREGPDVEFNPKLIWLLRQCIKADEQERQEREIKTAKPQG
jgi:hypothetical protein